MARAENDGAVLRATFLFYNVGILQSALCAKKREQASRRCRQLAHDIVDGFRKHCLDILCLCVLPKRKALKVIRGSVLPYMMGFLHPRKKTVLLVSRAAVARGPPPPPATSEPTTTILSSDEASVELMAPALMKGSVAQQLARLREQL